jgi:hypothetical protein
MLNSKIIELKKSVLKTILSSENCNHEQALKAFSEYSKLDVCEAEKEFHLYYVRHSSNLGIVPNLRKVG